MLINIQSDFVFLLKNIGITQMWLVRAASLLLMAGWWRAQATPVFHCRDLLQYTPVDAEQNSWEGVISLPAKSTTYPLWLNVKFDSKADFLMTWAEDVTSTNNNEFIINRIKMRTLPTLAKDIRFHVKYNSDRTIPKVIAIKLNGTEICNVESSQSAADRPIVDSNVTKTAEVAIRKKRQSSWMEYISTRDKKPVPSRPPGEVSNWMCYISRHQAMPSCDRVESHVDTTPQHIDKPGESWTSYITWSKPTPPDPSVMPAPKPNPSVDQPGESWTSYIKWSKPAPPGPSVIPAPEPKPFNDQATCGQVSPKPVLYKGNSTHAGQWPWQIALYHYEHVDNKFKCGGTLISQQHVVTAAHCVTLDHSTVLVNIETISVYLGRHNLRNSTHGVQIRFVSEVAVHPEYNATSFARDLSILTLIDTVQFTDFVRPVCLWPADKVELSNIIGKKGTVVGWGLDQNGVETDELGQIEIPVVSQFTCLKSNINFYESVTSNTTYCAGLGSGSTACQGDSGGGMVMNIEGTWYLRGLVSVSLQHVINGCDPSNYVVFTDLAKFLPWIKKTIGYTN